MHVLLRRKSRKLVSNLAIDGIGRRISASLVEICGIVFWPQKLSNFFVVVKPIPDDCPQSSFISTVTVLEFEHEQ